MNVKLMSVEASYVNLCALLHRTTLDQGKQGVDELQDNYDAAMGEIARLEAKLDSMNVNYPITINDIADVRGYGNGHTISTSIDFDKFLNVLNLIYNKVKKVDS